MNTNNMNYKTNGLKKPLLLVSSFYSGLLTAKACDAGPDSQESRVRVRSAPARSSIC